MIKYTNKKVIEVSDWDALVEKTYGKPYSFQQQDGCQDRGVVDLTIPSDWADDDSMNDSIPKEINGEKMGVKFQVWLDRDPQEWKGNKGDVLYLDLFWSRNFYPDLYTLANDLHAKGLIEAGDYSINIDW